MPKLPVVATALALSSTARLSDTVTRASGTGQPGMITQPRHAGTNGLPKTGLCDPWNGGNQKVGLCGTNANILFAARSPGGRIHGVAGLVIAADHNDELVADTVTNTYGEGSYISPVG
jgi:hypothetical protein